jgi:hypothetical protein
MSDFDVRKPTRDPAHDAAWLSLPTTDETRRAEAHKGHV